MVVAPLSGAAMADIFISYKKEDAGRVDRIVEGLRAEGFSVWWDHAITPGAQWDQTIQTELNNAAMVIAVWSELSVNAPWVKEEAGVGKARGRLLPVRIDAVEPPLGFGLIQMADLVGWKGDRTDDPQWSHFLASVKAVMSGVPVAGLERPVKRKSALPWILGGAGAVVLAVGVAGALWLQSISSLSVDYGDGSTTTVTRTGQPGPAPGPEPAPGSAAEPSPAEQEMFEKARASRLRSDYLDYLRAYPTGAFAGRVRDDILPFCKQEQQDFWAPQKTGQAIAGSVDQGYPTEAAACEAAKSSAERTARNTCNALGNGASSRNPQLEMLWTDCDCKTVGDGTWICNTQPSFSCTWEAQSFRMVDVCD